MKHESNPTSPTDDPPPYTEEDLANVSDVKYPQPSNSNARSNLTYPVVIPQRRPGTKNRGFLRAYAPVLGDHDIDEQTFLTFLKSFHKASQVCRILIRLYGFLSHCSPFVWFLHVQLTMILTLQASPIFNVISVGAGAIGHISEPFTIAVSISISVLAGTAAEIQSRYRWAVLVFLLPSYSSYNISPKLILRLDIQHQHFPRQSKRSTFQAPWSLLSHHVLTTQRHGQR